ncbi:hypothetical protein SPBR_08739 [Sporothrix brasiliensis 5110]|uniref:Uncharacterized protein n=1 Tax=Sporothrix brasiliensis 5110 TaxID=1398154 RepID=A0A0C2INN1_9PEZI|nr:uncharacterized protein SPBR_08739 [Sporothrix brasiliensis 5110]KIH86622.1 hypothetical protein SPBR_08739 [Sporothrix brasiliensis 5110]
MGNLCGKVDKDDGAFDRPGRTLGGAGTGSGNARPVAAGGGAPAKTAPVPPRVGGPARTLGGASGGPGSSAAADARERAAAAAEARNAPRATTGKLGAQLEAQRRENRSETLKKASEAEVRRREMDAQTSAAQYD